MENLFHLLHRVCHLLEAIYNILEKIYLALQGQPEMSALSTNGQRPLLGIQDVMEILGISRSSYYRFVKEGTLSPRILGNRHYYYLEDLDEQIRESKRRGRI